MSGTVLNIFYAAEPLLMAIALVAFLCTKGRERFPALLSYFVLRLTSFLALACLLHVHLFVHVAATKDRQATQRKAIEPSRLRPGKGSRA